MSGRPWLEALKKCVAEETSEEPHNQPEETSNAPRGVLTKPTIRSQCAGETQNVTDIRIARVVFPRGEDERRLIATGWKPKVRGGLLIWANPESGFYVSQELALRRLEARGGAA